MKNIVPTKILKNPDDLFKDLFSEFLKETNISIVYSSKLVVNNDWENDYKYFTYRIESINGCQHGIGYRVHLEKLTIPVFISFLSLIASLPDETQLEYLYSFNYEFEDLRNITNNSTYQFDERVSEFGPLREETFLSFKNISLIPMDENTHIVTDTNSFMFNYAHSYPLDWESSINNILLKIDSVINQIKFKIPQLPQEESKTSINKIKTNLSVPELAYLFRLLEDNKLIDIPIKKHLFKTITDTFQSKATENIKIPSFKNNFDKPDHKAIAFWEQKLLHLRQICMEDEKKY